MSEKNTFRLIGAIFTEKGLRGLQGILRVSHTVRNGHSFLNFDGFVLRVIGKVRSCPKPGSWSAMALSEFANSASGTARVGNGRLEQDEMVPGARPAQGLTETLTSALVQQHGNPPTPTADQLLATTRKTYSPGSLKVAVVAAMPV
jgi:hypothetical protein